MILIELLKYLLHFNTGLDIGQHHTSITQLLTDYIDLILAFLQISSYKKNEWNKDKEKNKSYLPSFLNKADL